MLPAPSVIVEWETGLECEPGRAELGLAEVNRQLDRFREAWSGNAELVIVHDARMPPSEIESLHRIAADKSWPGGVEIVPAPAYVDYYQKKNLGFAHSSGELVVFLDSDLLPEPGWLEALLEPFADQTKSVIVGATHFETRTLYERAMALFWIFDARCDEALLRRTRRLVSNNIAFRRALFAALPFPDRPTYRGQCSELGNRLAGLGIVMHEATAARCRHPAPRGPGGFLRRAFHAGRDASFYHRLEGRASGLSDCLREWRQDSRNVAKRIAQRAAIIGGGPATRFAAHVLGTVYYGTKAAAYLSASERAEVQNRRPRGRPPFG